MRAAKLTACRRDARRPAGAAPPGYASGVASGELSPHAELERARVERAALVLAGRLTGPAEPAARLVARRRGDGREVQAGAELDGGRWAAQLPFAGLAAAGPEDEVWDLALGGLRVGRRLDGLRGKQGVAVFPAWRNGTRELRPYYTVHDNLSIRSTAGVTPPPPPPRPARRRIAPAAAAGRRGRRAAPRRRCPPRRCCAARRPHPARPTCACCCCTPSASAARCGRRSTCSTGLVGAAARWRSTA